MNHDACIEEGNWVWPPQNGLIFLLNGYLTYIQLSSIDPTLKYSSK